MKTILAAVLTAPLSLLAAGTAVITEAEAPGRIDIFVEPYLGTTWGQTTDTGYPNGRACFNYYTSQKGHPYSGCVATAFGQVMRHCEWPTAELSVTNCTCWNMASDPPTGRKVTYATLGGVFDWSAMPKDTFCGGGGVPDENARRAIGKLTWDLAITSYAQFASTQTVSSVLSAFYRLKDRYGYANGESVWFNGSDPSRADFAFTEARIKDIVIPCCEYGSPVVLSLVDAKSHQHEVVVDGYGYDTDGLFRVHVLYGAGARFEDGWYHPPDFQGSEYAFDFVTNAVFNVFPQERGTLIAGQVRSSVGELLAGARVTLLDAAGREVTNMFSRAHGTYVFRVPEPGEWTISAEKDDRTGRRTVTVVANESRQILNEFALDYMRTPVIGNRCGVDVTLEAQYAVTVAAPTISPAGGSFRPSQTVTLACATPGATIRYTLDPGETDHNRWLPYEAPFVLNESATVRAKAWLCSPSEPSAESRVVFTYDETTRAGDFRARPIAISGTNGTLKLERFCQYTKETGELHFSGYKNPHTVWFRFVAPGTGTVRFYSGMSQGRIIEGYDYGYDYGSFLAVYRDAPGLGPAAAADRSADSFGARDFVRAELLDPIYGMIIDTDAYDTEYTYVPAETGYGFDSIDGETCLMNRLTVSVEQGRTYYLAASCQYDLGSYGETEVFFHLHWKADVTVAPREPDSTAVTVGGRTVPVPWTWLRENFGPLDAAGCAAKAVAIGANGLANGESYLLGLDPNDPESLLRMSIEIVGGEPQLDYSPKSARAPVNGCFYHLQGKDDLRGVWGPVSAGTRFFRVLVAP